MDEDASQAPPGGEGQGLEALRNFLSESGVECEVVAHERTLTARAEARAADMDPQDTAKTVVLRADDEYRLAVVPASERVDLRKVRELLGVSGQHLALATEAEIAEAFPAYEVGAVPPLGPHAAPEIVDRRLLEHDRVLCSGADHTHGLLIDPNDIVRVAGAQVADICEEAHPDE